MTTEQTESYGRFTGEPIISAGTIFSLDEADKEFIGKSRGDHNRLGIALQIDVSVFWALPHRYESYSFRRPAFYRQTARDSWDITVLAEYGQRENTRREHAALIRQHYQYRDLPGPGHFALPVFYIPGAG
ncbi:DUF4158 domain-containing protein [Serratia nevei]|uniref:DUF4158 domain-containing protein n=1 Tax=Serratia nevei TaxID=2703794 RepID=UPI002E17E502|nr:DUF4158 domain-containing protein [Serratia nevei]